MRRPQHDVAEKWNEEKRRDDALHRASEPATSTHSSPLDAAAPLGGRAQAAEPPVALLIIQNGVQQIARAGNRATKFR